MKTDDDQVERGQRTLSRREVLRGLACGGLACTGAAGLLSACAVPEREIIERRAEGEEANQRTTGESGPPTYRLPTDEGGWAPRASHVARLPAERPGNYRLQATVSVGGKRLQSNELRITVYASRKEDQQILADPADRSYHPRKSLPMKTAVQCNQCPQCSQWFTSSSGP